MKKSVIMKSAAVMMVAASIMLTACSKKSASAKGENQAQKIVRINFQTGSLCGISNLK